MRKTVFLVTGGAGFIGSNIVEELLRRGYPVRVLDNFSTGKKENLDFSPSFHRDISSSLEIIEGDIREKKDLQKALRGVDVVLHQAALRSVPRSIDDPMSTNEVNITGTLNLLLEAKKAGTKRVVYASSSSVYGDSKLLPQKETQKTSPISPYATSKLAAEDYCRVFAKTYGLETISLRYFNVFGPRQNPESKYAAVIPKFIESAIKGKPLEVHGDGKQSRDFSYISNVVSANILAAFAPSSVAKDGEVFNVACGESHSLLDIIKILEKITARKLLRIHTEPRAGDVRRTWADISKAKRLLKYKVLVDFEEGLEKTFDWFTKSRENRL